MANNSNRKNLDAEMSKLFINSDEARGVDAFEAASLDITQTARLESASPLAKTFAEQEEKAKGRAHRHFTPTPRPEPKAHRSEAEVQARKVPLNAWKCCRCELTNPLVGPFCWGCRTHHVCYRCSPA